MGHAERSRQSGLPQWIWWAAYSVIAFWAQDMSGGLDFLSPAVLICLQTGQWWAATIFTASWILVQEGVGNLMFGSSIVFFGGMHVLFFLARWLLEPENPLFIIFFSLLLAVWSRLVLVGVVAFQEVHVQLDDPWTVIGRQWLAYGIYWSVMLMLYRRWNFHGRV